MNFKCIQMILMMFVSSAVGKLFMMSSSNINMSRVLKNISRTTITACYMECARENDCHSIALTKETANQLPTCHLLKADDGYNEGQNVMTTLLEIGSGSRVHGGWGGWKNISVCDASCGGGKLNQSRDCDSPKPENGGDNCTGASERMIKCNDQSCPVLNCGNDLTASKGYIKSPNYPDDYENYYECRSTISGSSNTYIRITILDMDLETETKCGYDYLGFKTTNEHRKICGQEKWSTTFSLPLTITFKTDYSNVRKGFYLKWEKLTYGN